MRDLAGAFSGCERDAKEQGGSLIMARIFFSFFPFVEMPNGDAGSGTCR